MVLQRAAVSSSELSVVVVRSSSANAGRKPFQAISTSCKQYFRPAESGVFCFEFQNLLFVRPLAKRATHIAPQRASGRARRFEEIKLKPTQFDFQLP